MPRYALSLALLTLVAASTAAQRLQLELRPKLADTLRMRLDQSTEMSGARKGTVTKLVTTTMRMFSRAVVEGSSESGTLILAVTDSVDVHTTDEHARAIADQAQRQLTGRPIHLRLAPDGSVAVVHQTNEVPKEVTEIVSVMPASFPREEIAVGDTWLRQMPIPPSTRFGLPAGGMVRATFRLDSVSQNAELAFVSMRGVVERGKTRGELDTQPIDGSVNGSMVVNRRRGWLSDSRFLVLMRTTITSGLNGGEPMRFTMKITQRMHVFDER